MSGSQKSKLNVYLSKSNACDSTISYVVHQYLKELEARGKVHLMTWSDINSDVNRLNKDIDIMIMVPPDKFKYPAKSHNQVSLGMDQREELYAFWRNTSNHVYVIDIFGGKPEALASYLLCHKAKSVDSCYSGDYETSVGTVTLSELEGFPGVRYTNYLPGIIADELLWHKTPLGSASTSDTPTAVESLREEYSSTQVKPMLAASLLV